jgi:hypothetical protein
MVPLVMFALSGVLGTLAPQTDNAVSKVQSHGNGSFFWLTDFHLDIWGNESTPGDLRCAWMPSAQLQSAVDAMQAINSSPDFILVSGDFVHFPPRNGSDLSQQVILDTISIFTTWMMQEFPTTKLFPALGNHDYSPSNNWPVDPSQSSWLYDHLAEIWTPWLPASALATIKHAGWYAADVSAVDNLRIITLNTNYLTVYNTFLPWNTTIADEQFDWFETELSRARADGVKV